MAVILPKSVTHTYMLVNYVEQTVTHYKIAKYTDILGHNGLSRKSLDDSLYVQFPDSAYLCKIIMTSNDEDELKAVLASVEKHYQASLQNLVVQKAEEEKPKEPNYNEELSSRVKAKASICMYPIMSEDCYRNKMFILGGNGTAITERCMSRILWNDYKTTTYDLLDAVFTEESLASYATALKTNAKIELNPSKLQDIVSIVTDKCKVDKWDVHEVITKRLKNITMKCRKYQETIQK